MNDTVEPCTTTSRTRPRSLFRVTVLARISPGGGGTPHIKGVGMLVGNFELNP